MAAWSTTSEEEFSFLMIGKTGSGKSTTGNTILGADLFDSGVALGSVTSKCAVKNAKTPQGTIKIMDSPGLFDTSKSHEEISALVMQTVACMHPGPDAIFYVMKIGRYTDEEFGVYNRLKALLDESVTKYLILLFTHGDALKGKNMAQLLDKAPAQMKKVLEECEYRYVVMDNIHKEDRSQVEHLLQSVKQLQSKNGHKPYQCPKYAFVGDKMEKEVNKRMLAVEAKELQNKKHVQELSKNLKQTQEKADKEREEFEEKEKKREAPMAAQHQETGARLQELAEQQKAKQVSEEQQRQQMEALRVGLKRMEERQREAYNRQQGQEMERLKQLNDLKIDSMKDLMARKDLETKRMMEEHTHQMEKLKDEIAQQALKKRCTIS